MHSYIKGFCINPASLYAKFISCFVFLILLSAGNFSFAALPEDHAPIGVMGDHTHKAGEIMLSYRYMYMKMDGNRDGTNNLSREEVLEDFPVTPVDMDVQMHMFGAMYAPTDYITLMFMVPYIKKSMDHVTRSGARFETNSEGFGDIKSTGLFRVFYKKDHQIHLNLGMSFPTGSIDERDDTPAADNVILPYPMQLGSGTFDLILGTTYLGKSGIFSWGGQVLGTIRLGENDRDYSLGNKIEVITWGALRLNDWVSLSSRLDWTGLQNIDGADPALNPDMVPTADPDLRSIKRLDALFGINFINQAGPKLVKGHRLAVEVGFPLYQKLRGPQLETDLIVTAGWQYAF